MVGGLRIVRRAWRVCVSVPVTPIVSGLFAWSCWFGRLWFLLGVFVVLCAVGLLVFGCGVSLVGFSSVWCLGVYDSVWLTSFRFLLGDFVGLLCLIVVLMVWGCACDCGTLWASCLLPVRLVLGCGWCSLLLVFDCLLVMVLIWIDCVCLLIVLVFWFFDSVFWCGALHWLFLGLCYLCFCVFCLVAFTLVVITVCYTI